jgi:hypothetical protein
MGSRTPSTPKPTDVRPKGKKPPPRELHCRVEVGRGKDRAVRTGLAVLTDEELRFRTGRTGREGRDFNLHLRFDALKAITIAPGGGALRLTPIEGEEVLIHLGKHAPAWKEIMTERPGPLDVYGVKPRTRLAALAIPDEALAAELAQRAAPEDAVALDLIFVGAEHRADLARLGELAKRIKRPGGALWVVYPAGPAAPAGARGLTPGDIAAAGRAAGLIEGTTLVVSRTHEAVKLVAAAPSA